MKRTSALILAGLLLCTCGESQEERPGDPAVYARIESMTDCAKLQEQFDLAEATSKREGGPQGATWSEIGIAYMQAADDRMREVGCYG